MPGMISHIPFTSILKEALQELATKAFKITPSNFIIIFNKKESAIF